MKITALSFWLAIFFGQQAAPTKLQFDFEDAKAPQNWTTIAGATFSIEDVPSAETEAHKVPRGKCLHVVAKRGSGIVTSLDAVPRDWRNIGSVNFWAKCEAPGLLISLGHHLTISSECPAFLRVVSSWISFSSFVFREG